MSDATDWINALATVAVAITAIITIYYNRKLITMTVAKDKPFFRAYIERDLDKVLPTILYVKNEGGSIAYNIAIHIKTRGEIGGFTLKANESQNLLAGEKVIPVDLKIDSLTYTDIYGNKLTENNIPIRTIEKHSGFL